MGALALGELVRRIPVLLREHEVAVANAGWFTFLFANSLFLTLAIAGGLVVADALKNRHS